MITKVYDSLAPDSAEHDLSPSVPVSELSPALQQARRRAQRFALGSRASSTMRAYRSDWALFEQWCARHALRAMPAHVETVKMYLAELADGTAFPFDPAHPKRKTGARKASTIARHLATISVAHRMAKQVSPYDDEEVRSVLEGIRRELGTAPLKKTAAVAGILREMVTSSDARAVGRKHWLVLRDKAVLLVGFNGAFRRDELASLEIGDLEFTDDGVVITLRRSKTDQLGAGRAILIVTSDRPDLCAVRALRAWLEVLAAQRITEGAVFRSLAYSNSFQAVTGETIAAVVKRAAKRIGRDPSVFAGHSLRSGHVTSAIRNGTRLDVIQQQTGHKLLETLLGYKQRAGHAEENSSKGLL